MANWKKIIVSGSNISQLNNDANYITAGTLVEANAFATASFNGTLLLADSKSGSLNFASSSGQGLTISANAGTDTLTFGLASIPTQSLQSSGSTIGSTFVGLGSTVTTLNGLTLTNAIGSGSFSGSFQGDGSGLTGVISDPFPYTGSALITGSLGVTGSINGLDLKGNNSSVGSIAVGVNALANNVFSDSMFSTGTGNIAIGNSAMLNNTVGKNNIALGQQALQNNSVGNDNISFGYGSLFQNYSGSENIAFGTNTISQNQTGSYNIAIGSSAGFNGTSGSKNVYIGYNAGPSSTIGESNKLYIANNSGTPLIGGDFTAQTVNISGSLTVTNGITGSLFGTASWANNATVAVTASTVAVTDTTTGTGPYYVMFADGTTGTRAVRVDSNTLTFNATTNTLTVTSSYANQALSASFASTAPYSGLSGIPLGIVSGSSLGSANQGEVYIVTNGVQQSAIDLGLQTTDNPSFAGVTAGNVTVGVTTDNTINTTTGNLIISSIGGTTTLSDADVIITNNLQVNGTATYVNTQDLYVEDKFILLASGSATDGDGGIVIDRGTFAAGNIAFGYDSVTNRWGFQDGITDTSNTLDPTSANGVSGSFVGLVFTEAYHGATKPITGEFAKQGAIYTATNEDIWIYS